MRGQISVEFMLVCLLVVMLFSASVFVFSERNASYEAGKKLLQAKQYASRLARAANDVYLAGPGASASVFMPAPFDYNVAVQGRYLEVSFNSQFADAPLVFLGARVNSFEAGSYVQVRRVDQNVVIG